MFHYLKIMTVYFFLNTNSEKIEPGFFLAGFAALHRLLTIGKSNQSSLLKFYPILIEACMTPRHSYIS